MYKGSFEEFLRQYGLTFSSQLNYSGLVDLLNQRDYMQLLSKDLELRFVVDELKKRKTDLYWAIFRGNIDHC